VVILGIDPGTRVLGYGLVEWGATPRYLAAGVIDAPAAWAPGARIAEIGRQLEALLREFLRERRIDRAGMESGFMGGRSARDDLTLAAGRGVALFMVATVLGLEPVMVAPATVKKVVAGHGHADKKQVQAAAQRILGMRVTPGPDAADALGVAIAAAGIA
jgi:crossover junction endodeoxyribonuclease RuvC